MRRNKKGKQKQKRTKQVNQNTELVRSLQDETLKLK